MASQETRCREFAAFRGFEVVEVFRDDMTGGRNDRPGMLAMLKHLKAYRNDERMVIIDDISRFARDLRRRILSCAQPLSKAGGNFWIIPSMEFQRG